MDLGSSIVTAVEKVQPLAQNFHMLWVWPAGKKSGMYRNFPYNPLLPHMDSLSRYIHPSLECTSLLRLTNGHQHIIMSQSSGFMLKFILGVAHAVGWNKCLKTCTYPEYFRCLKNPLCSDYPSPTLIFAFGAVF